jgi:hypothetical protein
MRPAYDANGVNSKNETNKTVVTIRHESGQ